MEAATTIYVEVTQAAAHVMVEGGLTSGMVGVPCIIECGHEWDGLNKTVVFTAGNVSRNRTNVGNSTTVPAEVLAKSSRRLRIGVYGYTDDGTIVIPTVMADAGMILPGAKPSDDPGTDPELPIWAQHETRIKKLEDEIAGGGGNGSSDSVQYVSNADVSGIKTVLGNIMTILKAQVEDEDGTPQGYNMDVSGLVAQNETLISALGSSDGSGDTEGSGGAHTHSYTSKVTTAATCTTAGVRTYTCSCGHSYTEAIPATGHNYVDGVCVVCGADDPSYSGDVTLTSISAEYSGGDVTVGTALADLIGVVVTAHYSDGSTETVTDYTMSGTIAEGNNTVTVSYGGKTATFTVTGVAESGGDTTGETVEMLTEVSAHTLSFTAYSDGGETTASLKLSGDGGALASAEIFEEDTKVKITIEAVSGKPYIASSFASTDWDGVSTASGNAYYAEHLSGGGWTQSPATFEHEYTVRAGYRLLITNHFIRTGDSVSITVEKVVA